MKIVNGLVSETTSKANLLIAGVFQNQKTPPAALSTTDSEAFRLAKRALEKKRFIGTQREVFTTDREALTQAEALALIGLGKPEEWNRERARQCIARALHTARRLHARTVRFAAETFQGPSVALADLYELIPETLWLSDYRFDKYKKKEESGQDKPVESVHILYSKKARLDSVSKALNRARTVTDAVLFTRNLINEPANVMPPQEIAARAREVAREGKLRIEVFGLSEIKRKGMGGIIAVSQGSKQPPVLIVLEYGKSYAQRGTICLVGKGVTFDTGGISIKPSQDMEKMKYDMSGAACVIGTMKGVSRLKPKVHIVGIAPCVENMPSGSAQRPGDIIRMFNGKSVEVINTDAEGRLILGDALAYAAARFKPKTLIDIATLTGACRVVFADKAIGLLGTDERLIQNPCRCGKSILSRFAVIIRTF